MLYKIKNPHGGDVYGEPIALDFSSNVNPLGTPPAVIDAICRAAADVRQYPDPYCRELVRAIAAYEELPASYIFCGSGAAELIYAYCDARRPSRAAVLAPTFSEYASAAEHFGASIVRYALSEKEDFLLDEKILPFLKKEKPDVLFLCTPNNPTGRTIETGLLLHILACCRAQGTSVLLDECFLEFTSAKSAKNLLGRFECLTILKAFTKNYALAGVRVGYCLTADETLLTRMASCTQPWNVSVPAQAAGIAALSERDFLQNAKRMLPGERKFLSDGFCSLGFSVCPSEANYLLFKAPVGLDLALKKHRIAIRNCANYPGLGPGWYRTAVRLHEENAALLDAMRMEMEDASWHSI